MTKFADFVISLCEAKVATNRHIDTLRLSTASTASAAGVITPVNVYQYWTFAETRDCLAGHPAAVWQRFSAKMAHGPGLFGRAVTLHYGWGHDGQIIPKTVNEMSKLTGYQSHVFGGVFGLTDDQSIIQAPFNSARSDVMKATNFIVGGRIVFFYFFEETNLGTTQGAGPRITFRFEGDYDTYDRL